MTCLNFAWLKLASHNNVLHNCGSLPSPARASPSHTPVLTAARCRARALVALVAIALASAARVTRAALTLAANHAQRTDNK